MTTKAQKARITDKTRSIYIRKTQTNIKIPKHTNQHTQQKSEHQRQKHRNQ